MENITIISAATFGALSAALVCMGAFVASVVSRLPQRAPVVVRTDVTDRSRYGTRGGHTPTMDVAPSCETTWHSTR